MLNSSTLRPGLLVALKTHLHGNVEYFKTIIESDHMVKGVQKAKWETERTIVDPEELERAKQTRGRCSTLVRRVCAKSAFGLLCPSNRKEDLAAAIIEARKLCDAFNKSAQNTSIEVNVLTGEIAADDVEAVKAINSEVRDLLDDMQRGVKNLDVKAIRESASRARQLGSMLSPDAEGRVRAAIDAARAAATSIVKAGESAEIEVDRAALRRLKEARTSFLDVEAKPIEVKRPKRKGRAIEMKEAS